MKTFTCHNDPYHGWLQVSAQDLREAGLAQEDFSRYNISYRDGDTFYLEEDLDAGKFLVALRSKGIKYQIDDVFTDSESPIRAMQRIGG